MADLSIIRVPLADGTANNTYGARFEEYSKIDGTVRRCARVYDPMGSGSKDTSHIIDWVFEVHIPTTYTNTTGLKLKLTWQVDGLQTGNVLWGVKAEKIDTSATSFYTDTYGTVTTQATAVPTVSNGYAQTTISVVKARLGTPAAGDVVRICLYRDATSASDTASCAARVIAVQIDDY